MSFLSPMRKRPEARALGGLKCPACGGGLYLSRA